MAWYGGKGFGKAAEVRGPIENRVYVGNLAWNVSWKELKDHMKQVGEVAFADVMLEPGGRSRGCGLVAYRTADDAAQAIKELHDSDLMGRQIFVREDREQNNGSGAGGAGRQDCRVYVGNLPWSCTWRDLKDHFRKAGEISRADVLYEGGIEGGRSKGYGLVEFRTAAEAKAAVTELSETELLGRQIFVREDREASKPWELAAWGPTAVYAGGGGYGYGEPWGQYTKVFVGNLPFELRWQDLKDHMRYVGEVVHVEIMTQGGEPGGKSKGCGVVEFGTFGAARRAVERLHDSMLGGRMILVRAYEDEGGAPPMHDSGKGKRKGKGKGKGKD